MNTVKYRIFSNYSKKLQYSLFVLMVLCHFYLLGDQSIRETLNTMPKTDKEDLEMLFQNLFKQENFSYTLFGDKPVSLVYYFTTSIDSDGIPSNVRFKFLRRWGVWKKYAHAFPMTRYLLIEDPLDKDGSKDIYLINKKYFIKKVNEHLDLFQEVLGKDITGHHLFKKIEDNHKFLSFFDHFPLLLGILLGYGEHNARLYNNRDPISYCIFKKKLPNIPIKIPSPSKGFSTLQEEFDAYFSILTLFGDPQYSPLVIRSVFFVADHKHPETIALAKKYRDQRGKISAIYAKGDFLEIILRELTKK